MQLVCYVNQRDLEYFAENRGFCQSDKQASDVRRFLERYRIDYVNRFVCIAVLPDGADPDNALHPLHAYGDIPVMLRQDIVRDVGLACISDVQTTAVKELKSNRLSQGVVFDLTKLSPDEKLVCLNRLCSHYDERSYPEARLYRVITWEDVEPSCRQKLQKGQSPGDTLMGFN